MKTIFTLCLLLLLAGAARAEEAGIPASFPASRYGAAWERNPFGKKVVSPVQTQADLSRDWALLGMAEYDGKIRVSIVNKHTGEHRHLSNQDPANAEIRLIKATFSRHRPDASAAVEKDGRKATLKYSTAP